MRRGVFGIVQRRLIVRSRGSLVRLSGENVRLMSQPARLMRPLLRHIDIR